MPEYSEILQASGEQTKFETGARRDQSKDKGRFDLDSPIFRQRMALLLEKGAAHYGERNWEKGIQISYLINSALRHLTQFQAGMEDEDHACQAAFNLMGIVHTMALIEAGMLPASVDDRAKVPLLNVPKGVTTYVKPGPGKHEPNNASGPAVEERSEWGPAGLAGEESGSGPTGSAPDSCSKHRGGPVRPAVQCPTCDRVFWLPRSYIDSCTCGRPGTCDGTAGNPNHEAGPGPPQKAKTR